MDVKMYELKDKTNLLLKLGSIEKVNSDGSYEIHNNSCDVVIEIGKGVWRMKYVGVDDSWDVLNKETQLMDFTRVKSTNKGYVYKLQYLGTRDLYISLSIIQNQRFLLLQGKHWFQKEDNIRYLVNMLILLSSVVVGFLNFLK